MKLAHLLRSRMEWLGRPGSTILSSRLRLARNLRDRRFPNHADEDALREVLSDAFRACRAQPALGNAAYVRLDDVTDVDRELLMERHLISHAQARSGASRAVVVGPGERQSVMVNEEDHLRLQSLSPGLSVQAAWREVKKLDEGLGKALPFAYDERWGYLTACPTNIGTALRASCLAHLPALMITGRVQAALERLGASGMVVRGLYGEGTKVLGDLFQVSNATSLGPSETELLKAVEQAVSELIDAEEHERGLLAGDNRKRLEDSAWRALGLLTHARLLSFEEAIAHLSRLRLGASLGLLRLPLDAIDRLFFETRPAHLQIAAGKALTPAERDERRAELVREALIKTV